MKTLNSLLVAMAFAVPAFAQQPAQTSTQQPVTQAAQPRQYIASLINWNPITSEQEARARPGDFLDTLYLINERGRLDTILVRYTTSAAHDSVRTWQPLRTKLCVHGNDGNLWLNTERHDWLPADSLARYDSSFCASR